jgi:hypothetical protein
MPGLGPQFFRGMKPILLGRSVWTASCLPQLISERRDVVMSECDDAMPIGSRLGMPMSGLGVFESLP